MVRKAFAFCLALLAPACSLAQLQLEQNARAPAGWEGFCFPAAIAFLPDTDRISPATERLMPAIYDLQLKQTEWLLLSVSGGPDPEDQAARALASRRAQAALRLLSRLGTPPERVEVHIVYEGPVTRLHRDVDPQQLSEAALPMDWAAYVGTMIPPEQVERNRAAQRDNPRLVFC